VSLLRQKAQANQVAGASTSAAMFAVGPPRDFADGLGTPLWMARPTSGNCYSSFSHLPVWRVILAGLYCETDQLDEARAQIDSLARTDFKISLDWTWASVVMSLAQVCADLADQQPAALYYPQLQSVADQVGVTGIGLVCYGSLALPSGQLAACLNRWREAEQYFIAAILGPHATAVRKYVAGSQCTRRSRARSN
jgi:hypothetical protein